MEIKDALDIMNSDYKLWEAAEDEDLGNGTVAKTITLPWGIGEYTVNMEGMSDAGKRRAAVGAYGEHIRAVIDEQTNDEAITSRAKAQAARSESIDSGHGVSEHRELGVRKVEEVPQGLVAEADGPYPPDAEDTPGFGETLAARRVEVDGLIERHTAAIAKLCNELKGIDAALDAMTDEEL